MDAARPLLGVSSCLLGEEVRYDGGHKRDAFLADVLSEHFEFRPVCPEVAIGLGTPRPPIHLRDVGRGIRVVGVRDPGRDYTGALRDHGRRMAEAMGGISGYVFKAGSPSCGVWRVPVHRDDGPPAKSGRGAYADAFIKARPLLPVEEEGRLQDPVLRENFVARVFAYRRWQDTVASGLTPEALVRFHAIHKLILMSHDERAMRALGRLVAGAGRGDLHALADEYIRDFMWALEKLATRRRHADVLMHLMGYFKKKIDAADKQALLDVIHAYRRGEVSRSVPLQRMRDHFSAHPHPYVTGQVYLDPYPRNLMLRNTV